jgi:methyl-accepting chemotaxis protein
MRKSIFTKVLLSFLIIILLIVAQGAVAYLTFEKNDQLEQWIYEAQKLHSFLIEREVDHHLWMMELYDMFAGGPVPTKINSHKECNLGKWYYSYEPKDSNREYYSALEDPHAKLHNSSRKVVELFKGGQVEEAIQLFRTETIPSVELVRENLHGFKEVEAALVEDLGKQMDILDKRIVLIIVLVTVLSLIVALLLTFALTRSVVTPVKDIAVAAGKVADGDLTSKVMVESDDELGNLANAFNLMIDRLRILVQDIKQKSEFVVESSSNLQAISDETGKAAEEIASSIVQVAEGSEDIASQVNTLEGVSKALNERGSQVTESSNDTYKAAQQSEDAATQGWEAVNKSIEQFNSLKDAINYAAESMQQLGKRSAQIRDMVDLIQGIASQTNLLALNAAIEAARAGEHGKGFAVVAEEVRKLAEESSKAAGQITSLIEDIDAETTVTIQSMDSNVEQVEEQVKIIDLTGELLQKILQLARETRVKVQNIYEIAEGLKENSNSMEEAVYSIAAVVQENAASSEEVSASAEEQNAAIEEVAASADRLEQMARELEESIKGFKI